MTTSPKPTRTRSSIQLDLPAGWFFKESYTLLAPDGQANVIASSEPLKPSMGAKEYAEAQGDLLQSGFNEYKPHSLEPFFVHGVDGDAWLREFTWNPEGRDPVTQLQLYAVRPGRGFTVTATTPTADAERYYSILSDVLTSLVVEPDAADAIAAVEHREDESAANDDHA